MIRLVYSNHVEVLANKLAEELAVDRATAPAGRTAVDRLFEPTWVIVPNRAVETWLKLSLSSRLGIVGHTHFVSLLRFVRRMLTRDDGEERVITRDALQAVLAGLLHSPLNAPNELAVVHRYLDAGDVSPTVREIRRVQLAGQLARLFDDYRFMRPELIAGWQRGLLFADTPAADNERWQRRLWLDAMDVFENSDDDWILLERLLEPGSSNKPDNLIQALPERLYVFGLNWISPAERNLLARLAEHSRLSAYVLNPCMEFWEDVRPRWRHPELQGRFDQRDSAAPPDFDTDDPFGLQRPEDTPILQLWGRPGRESTRLMNAATDCNFEAYFVDPVEEQTLTVLHALQRDTLRREPPRGPDRNLALNDDSVTLLACPSIQREVEIVASRIWTVMEQDAALQRSEPLRFNDIAVLVPPSRRDAYLARIQTVFAEAWNIPHNVIDLGAGALSRFFEAVKLLLELPFGEFRRPQLLALLTHPNIAHDLGEQHDAEEWAQWCADLGIVHGADHQDHQKTYIDADVFNWQQGLTRLTLGAFMAPEYLDKLLVSLPAKDGDGTHSYMPLTVPADRLSSLAAFRRLVRGLIGAARGARKRRVPLARWSTWVAELLGNWLSPITDADRRVRDRCLQAFEEIGEIDVSGRDMGYREAYEFIADRLAGIDVSRGQYLADGVVVAALRPMRALPFKRTFVLGMGEGAFPAQDRIHPLDIRMARRRAGDVTPRELDMYAFLEVLLCTRQQLVVSWVDRDDQTGEPLAASTVLSELQSVLTRGYWTDDAAAERLERHPLRRFDPSYFPDAFKLDAQPLARMSIPDAILEARVAALRADLDELRNEAGVTSLPSLSQMQSRLESADANRLDALLGNAPIPKAGGSLARVDSVTITLTGLRRFLESPLQGAAEYLLRMSEPDLDDVLGTEDEVFETHVFRRNALLRDIFLEALHRPGGLKGPELTSIYDERRETLLHSGHHPIGPFGDSQRVRDLKVLVAWRGHAGKCQLHNRGQFRRVSFGKGSRASGPEVLGRGHLDFAVADSQPPLVVPLELDGARVDVEVHGATEPVMLDGHPPTILSLLIKDRIRAPDFLRPFVDAMVLAAAGILPETGVDGLVLGTRATTTGAWFAPLAAGGSERAMDWLKQILTDFLRGRHDYVLPIEAVCDTFLDERRNLSLEDAVRRRRDDIWNPLRARWGPIRDITPFEPPPRAGAVAERRHRPFLDQVRTRRPAWQ